MFLKKLEVSNFRNINRVNFNFTRNINIFVGENAQGKTNILESIYFLSITKSHRTNNEINLINKNEFYTKVSGVYEDDKNDIRTLSILLNENGKKVSVDNIMQKKISNYLSRLNVIMFSPDDLEIVKGSPSIRRKFLNIELSQLSNDYVNNLKDYNFILKERNEYLKLKNQKQFDNIYFDVITNKLIEVEVKIAKERYKFIDKINDYLSGIYNSIAGKDVLTIRYVSFIEKVELDKNDAKEIIKKKYDKVLENERIQKTTLLGIHKDDFKLLLNDLDVIHFASQGQQRITILSLKLAEIKLYLDIKNIRPIVLLDDIFSELDEYKKNNIIKYFNEDLQIFITTTDIKDINDNLKLKSDIYITKNGTFTREE